MKKALCAFSILLAGSLAFAEPEAKPVQVKPKEKAPAAAEKKPAQEQKPEQKQPLESPFKTRTEKISYGLGQNMGSQLKQSGVEVNLDIMIQGLRDGFTGAESKISPEEYRENMMSLQQELMAKENKNLQEKMEKNKAAGEAFMQEYKKKEGVITTPSGLMYRVIKEGDGATPDAWDAVSVRYTGKFVDGKVFDSTEDKDEPATFEVTRVVKGWSEALQYMKAGGKYEVVIPSHLAYGDDLHRTPPAIGPGQTLVFDVELVSVIDRPKPEEPKTEAVPQPAQ